MALMMATSGGAQVAPVVSGMAGAGAAEGTGLADVFSMLLGQVGGLGMQVGAGDTTMPSLLGQGGQAPTGSGIFSLTQTLTVGEGQTPVTVTGDAASVAAFVEQVETNLQALVQSGQITISQLKDGKELATALTQLGMSPDQATGVATRIETMLKVVETNLQKQVVGSTDTTGQGETEPAMENTEALLGQMAALMVAVMAPATQQAATETATDVPAATAWGTDYQVSLDVEKTAPTTIAVTLGQARKAFAGKADVVRQMTASSATATTGATENAATVTPQDIQETAPALKVTVRQGAEGQGSVSVVLASGSKPQSSETLPSQTEVASLEAATAGGVGEAALPEQGASRSSPSVSRGNAKEALSRPEGQTLYQWKSENGHETLKVVTPTTSASGVENATQQAQMASLLVASGGSTEMAAGATTEGQAASFAEKVAAARQMQAAHQVQVQMKPLLENGGGTVRMTLNPPELGRVEIELHVAHGKVQGVLAATQPAVVEQLARELHSFRQGLQDAGLNLGEQGIALMLNTSTQDQTSQGQGGFAGNGGFSGSGRGAGSEVSGSEGAEDAASWVSPDQLVDVRI